MVVGVGVRHLAAEEATQLLDCHWHYCCDLQCSQAGSRGFLPASLPACMISSLKPLPASERHCDLAAAHQQNRM